MRSEKIWATRNETWWRILQSEIKRRTPYWRTLKSSSWTAIKTYALSHGPTRVRLTRYRRCNRIKQASWGTSRPSIRPLFQQNSPHNNTRSMRLRLIKSHHKGSAFSPSVWQGQKAFTRHVCKKLMSNRFMITWTKRKTWQDLRPSQRNYRRQICQSLFISKSSHLGTAVLPALWSIQLKRNRKLLRKPLSRHGRCPVTSSGSQYLCQYLVIAQSCTSKPCIRTLWLS